jgi:hypothetical protein
MPIPPLNSVRLGPPQPSYSDAASEKLKSVARVEQTGPQALFAFPLPLLTYTSWQTELVVGSNQQAAISYFTK